jgi:hypothetical protein
MDFDDMMREVGFLNSRLYEDEDGRDIGSEPRRTTHGQLWSIVTELNEMLALGLDNTCLDLRTKEDRLVIHYWFGIESPHNSHEVSIYIDRTFSVERHVRDLKTGNVQITKGRALPGDAPDPART